MLTITKQLVSPQEFLSDQNYVGQLAHAAYPYWVDLFTELFSRETLPPVMVVDGAFATGKTTFCELAALRILYEILEYGGAVAYGLAEGEWLHVVLSGKRAVRLLHLMEKAAYFADRCKVAPGAIEFDGRVRVIEGPADDPAILGLNVAAYIADYVNGWDVNGPALRTLVLKLHQRMDSVRPHQRMEGARARPGLVLVTGAGTKNTDLFKIVSGVECRRLAMWEANPKQWSPRTFRVAIYPEDAKPKKIKRTRILEDSVILPEPDDGLKIITVPEDLRREFELDLRGSLRDMAGVPTIL